MRIFRLAVAPAAWPVTAARVSINSESTSVATGAHSVRAALAKSAGTITAPVAMGETHGPNPHPLVSEADLFHMQSRKESSCARFAPELEINRANVADKPDRGAGIWVDFDPESNMLNRFANSTLKVRTPTFVSVTVAVPRTSGALTDPQIAITPRPLTTTLTAGTCAGLLWVGGPLYMTSFAGLGRTRRRHLFLPYVRTTGRHRTPRPRLSRARPMTEDM